MTLKVTIKETTEQATYTVFYTTDDGVEVLPNGTLKLTSLRDPARRPVEFRIYAPGTWLEVNSVWIDDSHE